MANPSFVVDAVLFDMDGTLVDSIAAVNEVWTEFATTLALDPHAVRTFAHGTPCAATLQRFLPASENFNEWFDRIAALESGLFDRVSEIAGAIDATRSLPHERWAVVTSALRDEARLRLEKAGFPAPRVLIGADDVSLGKPDPEGFGKAARNLGVDPQRCVVFEDSPAGLEAALAVGAIAVVVGDLEHDVTRGLRRINDWKNVTFTRTDEGRVSIGGIPEGDKTLAPARG